MPDGSGMERGESLAVTTPTVFWFWRRFRGAPLGVADTAWVIDVTFGATKARFPLAAILAGALDRSLEPKA
jgi:hypothetical protein